MKTGKNRKTLSGWKLARCCMAFLMALMAGSSCGNQNDHEITGSPPEEISGDTGEENKTKEDSAGRQDSEDNSNGITAVADFYYLPLSSLAQDFARHSQYTINGQWMYYTRTVYGTGDNWADDYIHIDRSRISDGYEEQDYFVSEESTYDISLHVLLADEEGNGYGFWGPGPNPEKEENSYFLEKYGSSGEVLWHEEYSAEELQDVGEALNQGTVTEDGRIFLYTQGAGGRVFSFSAGGSLEEIYVPELKSLEGIVGGKDGKVYGYCITGSGETLFAELGGSGAASVCPLIPLGVYDGHGSDVCLYNREGMWNYDPDTGEAERLWTWKDEYIQIDSADIGMIVREGDRFTIMCSEQWTNDTDRKPVRTFAFVTLEDSRDYPPRQVVTLATTLDSGRWKSRCLDLLVKRYNRQSRKYQVEIVEEEDQASLEMKFIKGEASDLIDLTELYAGNLAGIGALEDLTPYYSSSDKVTSESILDSVKEACFLGRKNVLVMPDFCIQTVRAVGEITVEDWDIWEFLEMGRNQQMFKTQSPEDALMYAMGVRCGEGFVDYENNKSSFDSPEFRRILEACSGWQACDERGGIGAGTVATIENGNLVIKEGGYVRGSGEKGWLFDKFSIPNPWWAVSNTDKDYTARMVGYPGAAGAEYKLSPDSIFAMNSASQCKEGAWDFLEYILSQEMQDQIDWAFPVRKDSFEKCLTDVYVSPVRTQIMPFVDLDTGERMENGFLKELTPEDIAAVRRMAELAVYDSWGARNNPLWEIVADEAGMYFKGDASLEDTVKKIQNRVQLYLDEKS